MDIKKIALAVSEFALPAPRKGSIDVFSGFGRAQAQQAGIEIHQRIQASRRKEHPNYKAESWISRSFISQGYEFAVSGKMDGFFADERAKIEEIKTTFNIYELLRRLKDAPNEHPYCLQIKTYGYFYWLEHAQIPDLTLHLVSTRDGESVDFDLNLDILTYEAWLNHRLAELIDDAIAAEKRAKRRKKASSSLQFPFAHPRPGQIDLIETIEEGMRENRPMLIQAPTGLGKTVGVLYPTLREALGRGQRLVYITPKNSQHGVAEDAIDKLQEQGAPIRAMTLTAKSKMCLKNEPLCNPVYCEFARDHYTKVAEHKVIEQLSKKRKLTARVFKKMATEYEVCPFEIQIDAAQDADVVICDYNYVFAPRSALGRLSGCGLDQEGKPNLVIDEAHNLPARAMDYYSPALSTATLEKMREDIQNLRRDFRKDALALLDSCIAVVKSCAPPDCRQACKVEPPIKVFMTQDAELRQFLASYLKSDVEIEARDVVLRLCFYWAEFTGALEFVSGGHEEFFTTYNPNPPAVRITCCDASEMLKSCYDDYGQVVAFSATVKPFEFYSRLAGMSGKKDLKTAEFVSPFPKSRRKLLIIPQISSKYSERERNYPRIAEAIERIVELKRGNYFAFFPSFDFMARVLHRFRAPQGFEVLQQERNMNRDEIDHVIERLRDPSAAHIVFAVQGGVFSEGVDYPGDMVIGAFVVGPPLPNFDLERETMRDYYQKNYESGFDYAYVYPAMAKAVQAAGRVIRSETDRGLIVLMDNRFMQSSFANAMPQDWFDESPRELVSASILRDIAAFWSAAAAPAAEIATPGKEAAP